MVLKSPQKLVANSWFINIYHIAYVNVLVDSHPNGLTYKKCNCSANCFELNLRISHKIQSISRILSLFISNAIFNMRWNVKYALYIQQNHFNNKFNLLLSLIVVKLEFHYSTLQFIQLSANFIIVIVLNDEITKDKNTNNKNSSAVRCCGIE